MSEPTNPARAAFEERIAAFTLSPESRERLQRDAAILQQRFHAIASISLPEVLAASATEAGEVAAAGLRELIATQMRDAVQPVTGAVPAANPEQSKVMTLAPKTVAEVMKLFADRATELNATDVRTGMKTRLIQRYVSQILSALVQQGKLRRVRHGVYAIA